MRPFQRAAGWCKAVRQAFDGITSEQRTEVPQGLRRLRRVRPITRNRVPEYFRNKSGTAEDISPLSLI